MYLKRALSFFKCKIRIQNANEFLLLQFGKEFLTDMVTLLYYWLNQRGMIEHARVRVWETKKSSFVRFIRGNRPHPHPIWVLSFNQFHSMIVLFEFQRWTSAFSMTLLLPNFIYRLQLNYELEGSIECFYLNTWIPIYKLEITLVVDTKWKSSSVSSTYILMPPY